MVHRFIVRETIEERILATVAESGAEQWSDDCVTLQQMYDLFSGQGELSLELSLMRQSSAPVNVSHTVTRYSDDSDSDLDNSLNQGRPALAESSVSNQENGSIQERPGLGTFNETSESDQATIQGSSAHVSFSETNDSIRDNQGRSSLVRFGDSSDFDRDSGLIDGRPALVTFVNIDDEEE